MRIRRVHDIADGTIGGRLTTDDVEFLPPSRLELQSNLDGWRCVVHRSFGDDRGRPCVDIRTTCQWWDNIAVFLLDPSTSRRARGMCGVERYRQGFAVVAIFDGDGPNIMLRFSAHTFRMAL